MKEVQRRPEPARHIAAEPAGDVDKTDRTRQNLRGLGNFEAQASALAPVQLEGPGGKDPRHTQRVAAQGTAGRGGALPHLSAIQASFGGHDVSGVQSHVGGQAADACQDIGATAYASGDHVAFQGAPDLHTAAHEAAHVVQQRAGVSLYGGVGKAGDPYEKHADAVADAVVQGKSAAPLLDQMAGQGGGAAGQAGANAPVQTYVRVPVRNQVEGKWAAGEDLRVADDGKMAVADVEGKGSKRMWATADIVGQSAALFAKQGSPFRAGLGGGTLQGKPPGGRQGERVTLREVVPLNLGNGTDGDAMRTVENCNAHGHDLMGAGQRGGRVDLTTGMAVVTGRGEEETEHRYDKRGTLGGLGTKDERIMKQIRARLTGEDMAASEDAYRDMGKRDKDRAASELGANQYADPQVGEALAVYPGVEELRKSFPMHFAGVFARSGGDYVTLENYGKNADRAEGDSAESSNAWYFKMYGPVKRGDDQSFYGENVRQGDYGGERGTLVLKHRKVDGYDEPALIGQATRLDQQLDALRRGEGNYARFPSIMPSVSRLNQVVRSTRSELQKAWEEQRAPDAAVLQQLEELYNTLLASPVVQAVLRGEEPTPEVAPAPVVDAEPPAQAASSQ